MYLRNRKFVEYAIRGGFDLGRGAPRKEPPGHGVSVSRSDSPEVAHLSSSDPECDK